MPKVFSQVAIQKSIREGFGLPVAEAMWKGRPVIGGNVGGIRLQIEDGVTGYLVSSSEECAQRIVELVLNSELHHLMGAAAREAVRQHFLLPRLALDYIQAATAHFPDLGNNTRANSKGHNNFEKLEICR